MQWQWLQDVAPEADQFNSIHDRLIAGWKDLKPFLRGEMLHFAALDTREDILTASYLQDTAAQAGVATRFLGRRDLGWEHAAGRFVDLERHSIDSIFKLYPWEWLVREEFAEHLMEAASKTLWIEPAWKMLLSNKGILPVLWELFLGHPNLLEAHFEQGALRSFAKKPLLSREGANISLVLDGVELARGADDGYGKEGFIYQALTQTPALHGGHFPILGSWVIQGEPAGIGIRESDGPITDNLSRFVPHLFAP